MSVQVPAVYIRELSDFCAEEGIPTADLLAGTGIPASVLEDPHGGVSRQAVHRLLQRTAALAKRRGFALLLGARLQPGHHGFLGHAMICARNVRDSLKMLERFAGTRGIPVDFRLIDTAEGAELRMEPSVPLGRLRASYIEWALMIVFSTSAYDGSQGSPRPVRIRLDFPEPPHHDVYRRLLACPIEFDALDNAVVFDRRTLDSPLVNTNGAIRRFCEERCELILSGREETGELADRVRNRLLSSPPPFPTAPEIARSLGVSERALRRRLAAEGASLRALVREVRENLACRYLTGEQLTVEEVSRLLGYSEQAAFNRAFRAWTGRTPSEYRRLGTGCVQSASRGAGASSSIRLRPDSLAR